MERMEARLRFLCAQQDACAEHRDKERVAEALHKGDRADHRRGQSDGRDVRFDARVRLKVRDAGLAFSAAD